MTPVFLIIVAIFVVGRKLRIKQRSAQATYSDLTEFGQVVISRDGCYSSF